MRIFREDHSGISLLRLQGEFDSFVLATPFTSDLEEVRRDGIQNIVLNMSLVSFVNSAAIGALIREAKHCRKAGGDLILSQPSGAVRETIESLGLDRRFTIRDDDATALEGLRREGPVDLPESAPNVVMLRAAGISKPLVCRLRTLAPEFMEVEAPKADSGLVEGREVQLRFRLALYSRDFFDLKARISSVTTVAGRTKLSLRFTQIDKAEQEAIDRFCDDIRALRDAAREEWAEGEGPGASAS